MKKSRVHAVAGVLGLTLITLFFTSTVVVELVGNESAIVRVKTLILFGVLVLVPSMIVAGGTGRILAGRRTNARIQAKKKRMTAIGVIGLTILVPCAVVLQRLSATGDFSTAFYVIQAIELVAGATNITLMGLNVRDGRSLAGRSAVKLAGSR